MMGIFVSGHYIAPPVRGFTPNTQLICPTGKSGGDGKANKSSPGAENIPLVTSGKSMVPLRASRARSRGAFRDRHERWTRDAMDA
jgi:hypothetical protein